MIVLRRIAHLSKLNYQGFSSVADRFSVGLKNVKKDRSKILTAGMTGTLFAAGYVFYKSQQTETMSKNASVSYALLENKPDVPIARKLNSTSENFDLDLTLFQYPTCPFCCKVRAFLDYYGIPYEVVEVDPVLRQQTSWTSYKKVPILLAKVDGGYQQLNDSSMIVSALKTYFVHKSLDLKEIVKYYPMIELQGDNGKMKLEVMNKYSVMTMESLPEHINNLMLEEKKWREWADHSLVHTLSPNVYRNFDESIQAFLWFSEMGEWDKLFPSWERNFIVYVGALAMWGISKRLKKRHNLKDDVRESLYDECRKWMKTINNKKTTFMGGSRPNLADLAVYGVLSSIEGCLAFQDLLRHTSIGQWYYPMKEVVSNHKGIHEIKA